MNTSSSDQAHISNKNISIFPFLLATGVVLFASIIIRRAWLSDDAFITFRTIDNLWNGYGLVWNPGERVQTYTHPLWMGLLAIVGWLTRDLVFTTLILSIIISLVTVIILISKIAVSRPTALFGLFVLILSNSFVDYSTSGLENPISHLILVIFFGVFFLPTTSPKKIFILSLIASFGILTRYDLFLFFLPAILYELYQVRSWRSLFALAAGQVPLLIWMIFSILYYGFPFPNTAYAKLNTGIPGGELIVQGITYFRHSANYDPLTITIIASGLLLALLVKNKQILMIGIGIILYLLYIVIIGGDFMSGRFLAAPFLCSLIIISRFDLSGLPKSLYILLFAIVGVLGFLSPWPTLNFSEALLTAQERSAMVNDSLISNERKYYEWSNSLFAIDPETRIPGHPYALEGLEARQAQRNFARRITVGMFGYYAGPQVHVLDELALGDPLLARLPARRVDRWRVGHFQRTIPDGYIETLQSGENRLADSRLSQYYDQLTLITKGNLLDPKRWQAIWLINTGKLNHLIDQDTYRLPRLIRVEQDQVSTPKTDATAWDASGNILFEDSGLEIVFERPVRSAQAEISLDGNNSYQVEYLLNGVKLASQKIKKPSSNSGLQSICLATPSPAREKGFDALRIFAVAGDSQYSLGHFILDDCPSTKSSITPANNGIITPTIQSQGLSQPVRLLALGDSYTIGEGLQAKQSWPNLLIARLRDNGIDAEDPVIIARTGWTTEDLKNGIRTANLQGTFDIVTLLIGVNNQFRGQSTQAYQSDLSNLIDQAIEFAGNRPERVIILSIPDWGVTPYAKNFNPAQISQEIDDFNRINRDEAKKRGIHYVDITPISREGVEDRSLIARDGLHPSKEMYARWVDLVLPLIIDIESK